MNKKRVLLALTLMLALCLTGCNKEGGSTGKNETVSTSKKYVYTMQDLGGMDNTASISQIVRNGDNFYAYGYEWSDDGETSNVNFYPLNEDGSLGEKSSITMNSNESYNSFQMDAEGNLYCIKNVYGQVYEEEPMEENPDVSEPTADTEENTEAEETENTEDGTAETEETTETAETAETTETVAEEEYATYDEEAEYTDDYYLIKMKLDGTEIFSVKLNDIPELKALGEQTGYFYVGSFNMTQDNSIYLSCMDSIVKFDADGNYQKVVADPESPLAGVSLYTLENGKMAATIYEDTGISIAYADLEAGTLGEKFKIPGVSYEYSFYPGVGYDLYMVNTYGVYGYNIGDADKTQIMSYIDSDFAFYNIYGLAGISDTEFIAMYDDEATGMGRLARFTKVPPEEVKDREIITLAMAHSDWSVRSAVVDFNKVSENYRITIQDYSSMYGSETDYTAGVTRLNTDIVSGKVPDIILLDSFMPISSYISKGLFEDIKPYIEKDEELDIDNYMPNIIEAFSVDGKLYSVVPTYAIQTLVAKASDVGTERGWTVKEAQDILASKPEGTQFIGMVDRNSILDYSMTMAGNQFVDLETGKCSFNSEGFIELLEFAGTFPEVVDDTAYSDDYWNNYESMWREGKIITSMVSFGDFRNYNYTEKGTFGEKITMIGFPSVNGDGSVIMPNLQLALSAKSKTKEGAWEFLRIFLTDEYQENEETWGLPLSIKALDKKAENAQQKNFYMDEYNNKVEYDDTYYLNGMEIIIDPMTEAETEAFKEQLYTFTQVYNSNDALLTIIQEEAAPYFSGQKSAKDVADIIQSRAQLYVHENR